MMVYENKRNGQVAELVGEDAKTQTVMLKLRDEAETVKRVTNGTLKRWWKKIEEVEEVEEVQEESESAEESVQVEEEADLQKADCTEKKTRQPKPLPGVIEEILNYIFTKTEEMGGTVFFPAKDIKMRSLKLNGKMFASLNYSSKGVRINCRSKAVAEVFEPDKTQNHMFDALYLFNNLSSESVAKINSLLRLSFDFQLEKKNKKKEVA